MTYDHLLSDRPFGAIHTALLYFPIACLSLTVVIDLAYLQTLNLLWLHFFEWLLLAGLVFGGISLIACVIGWLVWRVRPSWLAVAGGIVVMLLATINSLVDTADGWTAVMPFGLALSILTLLAMIITDHHGLARIQEAITVHRVAVLAVSMLAGGFLVLAGCSDGEFDVSGQYGPEPLLPTPTTGLIPDQRG